MLFWAQGLKSKRGAGFRVYGSGLRWVSHCRASSAHIRQSRPHSGLGFKVQVRNAPPGCLKADTGRISGSKGAGGADDARMSTQRAARSILRLHEHRLEAFTPPPVPAAARLTSPAQPSQSTTRHRTETARVWAPWGQESRSDALATLLTLIPDSGTPAVLQSPVYASRGAD